MPPLPSHVLRDPGDRLPILLTSLPLLVIAAGPSPLWVALSVWWIGNTVAHQATHRRLFRTAAAECAFAIWLSLLLGVPQRLWQQQHLAHHAERRWRPRADARLFGEIIVLAGAWLLAVLVAPHWLVSIYVPGLAAGLGIALVHGHFEHRGGTTSIHAPWWNVLMLNDGYHVEHHAAPRRPWHELPAHRSHDARCSLLPPPLRWLEWLRPAAALDRLERWLLRSPRLAGAVLHVHRRALARVLAGQPEPRTIVVVGGGLFPRSAILLRELWPAARIIAVDAEASHLTAADSWWPADVERRVGRVLPVQPIDADLVVLPLALRGGRRAFLQAPPAPRLLVHDWALARLGHGALVAWWLGKRVYLVSTERPTVVPPA